MCCVCVAVVAVVAVAAAIPCFGVALVVLRVVSPKMDFFFLSNYSFHLFLFSHLPVVPPPRAAERFFVDQH